jgi:hypothetical protein
LLAQYWPVVLMGVYKVYADAAFSDAIVQLPEYRLRASVGWKQSRVDVDGPQPRDGKCLLA